MANIEENSLNPGKQLQELLKELYPFSQGRSSNFIHQIDNALKSEGELSELIYNSTINYMMRRLIFTAEFLRRKCNKNNLGEDRFILDLRNYLKENTRIPTKNLERILVLLRECLKARKKEIAPSQKKHIHRRAKQRDERCYMCGCKLDFERTEKFNSPEIEHNWPRSMGGVSEEHNLQISCSKCNSKKRNYIDYSDFHYEEICIISDEDDDYFSTKMTREYEIALWAKSNFKCKICGKPASNVGKLKLSRINLDDSWHFLNIDAYCEQHAIVK
jgi:5-methylcytosine-specific restriction endonuclease McrA